MAVTKIADIGTKKRKPTLRTIISSENVGAGNKTMILQGSTALDSKENKTLEADSEGNIANKVGTLRWGFNSGTRQDTGGEASALVFSFCSNSSGDNPVPFFVAGGFQTGTGEIKFPVPLKSPYAETHISIHGVGTQVGSKGSFSESSTYSGTSQLILSK